MRCLNCGNYWLHLPAPDSEPGEVVQCKRCGHLQIFTDDLNLRELDDLEKAEMARDPRIWRKNGTWLFIPFIGIIVVLIAKKLGLI